MPRRGARLAAGRVPVAGVAWAPDRGMRGVEVKVDDGAMGGGVDLEPDLGGDVGPVALPVGRDARPALIEVRAIDGTGDVQTDARSAPAPDGARGHHIDLGERRLMRPAPDRRPTPVPAAQSRYSLGPCHDDSSSSTCPTDSPPAPSGEPGNERSSSRRKDGRRVVSVALEKAQVAVLAERLGKLLVELDRRGIVEDPPTPIKPDERPLDEPINEAFRATTLTLGLGR